MSFFAGAFSLGGKPVGPYADAIEAASGLSDRYSVSRFVTQKFVLIHGDLGILPERGWRADAETVSAIAGALYFGEKRLYPDTEPQPELRTAAERLGRGETQILTQANGTFALCVYSLSGHKLRLASDSLGGRPLYYAIHSGALFFATSSEALRRLKLFPLTVDLVSYFEQEAVYYPTGSRSTIREIGVLVDNQVLEASAERISTSRYFDWASVEGAVESEEALALRCATSFQEAMRCRIQPGTQASLLSGGLDSRLIVADLHARGCPVEAVNLAPENSQDLVYAQRFAAALDIPLSLVPWHPGVIGASAEESTANLLIAGQSGLKGRAVFSGDGGGETFGFLLMNEKSASLLRQGKLREGAREYLSGYQPPKRIFRERKMRNEIYAGIRRRLEEELQRFNHTSHEKNLHIFTLCHDMRRHLYGYFDRASEASTELLLPFYDRRVIESVIRIPAPLTAFLKHRFYHRMLDFLPPTTKAAPWQTYRGHAPCPVPDPNPPADQWSLRDGRKGNFAFRCARVMLTTGFPPFLRRRVALAAMLAHGLGRANYDYLFKACINLASLHNTSTSYSAPNETCCSDDVRLLYECQEP